MAAAMADGPPEAGTPNLASIDEAAIRTYRAARIRQELRRREQEAVLVVDPVNLRYATGTRNMQVWTMHNIVRYALVFAHGPTILFDLATGRHLSAGLESVSDVRPSIPFDYMLVADNAEGMARRWAAQIHGALKEHGCAADILAVDRADTLMVWALGEQGTRVIDGKAIMEHARAIKSAEEIAAFRASLSTCEESVRSLYEFAVPGLRESEAFGHLVGESLARGGEYPETRLLTAGPRTNPWFQEASDRVMQAGELLSFDTDLIGPMGFYNDISRSWVVGDRRPTAAQATLLDLSRTQIEHNIDLLRPGMSFVDFADRAFRLPDAPAQSLRRPSPRLRPGSRISLRAVSGRCGRRHVRRPIRAGHDRLRRKLCRRARRPRRCETGTAGADYGKRSGSAERTAAGRCGFLNRPDAAGTATPTPAPSGPWRGIFRGAACAGRDRRS